ncbi:hypothetical protein [Promicromonospora sp. NPDC059942]|uniref:hypothetical protein n=1 Tax=Promicromonospora sp. NPDC059942 TaxID=3347009 RepID=UPI00364DC4B2
MPDGARPVLFLDVDGTLLPFGGPGGPSVPGAPAVWTAPSNPWLAQVDGSLGPLLVELECDLVWATAWMDAVNDVVSPLLGLPRLPVAELPAYSRDIGDDRLQWKTRALVRIAAGRPFVWVDDVISDSDRLWVADEHPGAALLHGVDPAVGVTAGDLAQIAGWLHDLGGRP